MKNNKLSAFVAAALSFAVPAFGAPKKASIGMIDIDIAQKFLKDCRKGKGGIHELMKLRRAKSAGRRNVETTLQYLVQRAPSGVITYERYLACTSLASASPASCDKNIATLGDAPACYEMYLFSMMAGEVLKRRKNGAVICRKIVKKLTNGKNIPKGAVAGICREMAGAFRSGKSQALCAQLSKVIDVPPGFCASRCFFFAGRSSLCGSLKDDGQRGFCVDIAKLISGLRSGRAGACAASPFCGAVTRRKTSACAPILARANKSFCKSIVAHGKALKTEAARRASEMARRASEAAARRAPEDAAKKASEAARREKVRADRRKMEIERAIKAVALAEKTRVDDFKKSKEREAKRLRRLDNIHRIKQRIREESEPRQYGKGERMAGHPTNVQDARRGRKSSRAGVERRIRLWEKKQAEKKEEEEN